MSERLYRVVAPHFVAGVRVGEDDIVCGTAPILGWARGCRWNLVRRKLASQGWRVEMVECLLSLP